jgi:DNA helicase-2/ATP-dependent DNA helicase PcrA
MAVRKILGPPGTGKTTKLLKYVKTFLKLGTPIDKIGYFAFTKKAAGEAVDRMLDYHTAFEKKDLKHFRTLHSLAFTQLGLKKSNVMQDEHYQDIGRKLGIEVTVYSNGEEKTGFVDSDSEYFNIINAARIKNITIEEEYNTDMYSEDIDKHLLQILKDEVDNYKESFGLVDFTDMIEKFNVAELCPKYDVIFVDEAQDLSPIQWKMYDILKKNSKHVILAGDDDQAIYGWAGADVQRFQDEPAKNIVLPQSYRVPQQVQFVADQILSRIPDNRRIKKLWAPRPESGTVEHITAIEDAPLHDGDWLVLSRTNDKLNKLKPILKDMAIYFEIKGRKSYKTRLYTTVKHYTRWQQGDLLSLSEVKDVLEQAGQSPDPFPTEERMYDLTEFDFYKEHDWYEVFTQDYEECLYIREMLRSEEQLSKPARVRLSTIHAAKGGEATNVLLILDNTKKIRDAIDKSEDKNDEEHRVWYVGVTRAKQNLYIMTAKQEDKGYDIESVT